MHPSVRSRPNFGRLHNSGTQHVHHTGLPLSPVPLVGSNSSSSSGGTIGSRRLLLLCCRRTSDHVHSTSPSPNACLAQPTHSCRVVWRQAVFSVGCVCGAVIRDCPRKIPATRTMLPRFFCAKRQDEQATSTHDSQTAATCGHRYVAQLKRLSRSQACFLIELLRSLGMALRIPTGGNM